MNEFYFFEAVCNLDTFCTATRGVQDMSELVWDGGRMTKNAFFFHVWGDWVRGEPPQEWEGKEGCVFEPGAHGTVEGS